MGLAGAHRVGGVFRPFKRMARHMVFPAVYFIIAFNIVVVTDALAAGRSSPDGWTISGAVILALLAAKVVLVVDTLPFMRPGRTRPILLAAAWRGAVYWAVALLVLCAERMIRSLLGQGTVAPAVEGFQQPRFWAVQIWVYVLLFVYCTLHEVILVLGPERAGALFLGTRPPHRG
jgi:hypothetical protein